MTPINNFESDVMGIMHGPEFLSVDEISNRGFTPLNNFVNDVLGGVTLMDDSAPDWQI